MPVVDLSSFCFVFYCSNVLLFALSHYHHLPFLPITRHSPVLGASIALPAWFSDSRVDFEFRLWFYEYLVTVRDSHQYFSHIVKLFLDLRMDDFFFLICLLVVHQRVYVLKLLPLLWSEITLRREGASPPSNCILAKHDRRVVLYRFSDISHYGSVLRWRLNHYHLWGRPCAAMIRFLCFSNIHDKVFVLARRLCWGKFVLFSLQLRFVWSRWVGGASTRNIGRCNDLSKAWEMFEWVLVEQHLKSLLSDEGFW
jgi:hypothetical protein